MAQILKFQGGGSTPTSSWGTFTIDNVTYNMDDANIKRLYDHAKTLDPDVAYQFDFIINTLKSGKNLSYANNKLYGGVDFETSERQARKINEKVARGSGKGRDARLAISSLDNLKLENPTPETKKIDLSKRFAEYERDNEGALILDKNNNKKWIKGANNQEILDLLDKIETYALSTEDFEIAGLENKNAQWLRNFYNSYGREGWANLKNSISNGTWNQATVEALNDINLFLDRQATAEELAEKTKREQEEAAAKANTEKTARYGARKLSPNQEHLIAWDNTSKSFKIVDPNAAQFIASLGNVWLNNEFAQKYPMYAPLLEGHDNGLFYVNGKLYDAEDDELLKIPLVQQWIDENKRKVGGSNLITWDWIPNTEDTWITNNWNGQSIYNTYTGLNNYRDLTGLYDNLGTYANSPISNIFQVYPDQITPEMYDDFGFFKPEYYEYKVYSNNNPVDIESESFNKYLKSLKLASDSQKEQYYSNLPSYLKPSYEDQNGNQLVQIYNNVWWDPKSNEYITLVKTKDGKYRYVYLTKDYNKGLNPLDYVNLNDPADLSSFGLSNKYGIPIKKKGGKIPKAKYGWVVDLMRKSGVNDYLNDPKAYVADPTLESGIYNPNDELLRKAKVNAGYVSPVSYKPEIITTTVTPEQRTALSSRNYGQYGSNEGSNESKLNTKGSDLIGLGRFISDLASAHKIYKNNIEAFNDLKSLITPDNPIYTRPIFSFNSGKYQQAKQQLLNAPIVKTSDPTATHVYTTDKLGKLIDLDLAYNTELSDAYNKYQNELRAIDNKETQDRIAGLKEYKSKLAQIRQMELNALNQRDLTIAQNIENKGLELQGRLAKDEQARTALQSGVDQLKYNENYMKAVEDRFNELGGFSNWTAEDYEYYGRDILSYMAAKYPYELAAIKQKAGLEYKFNEYNNNRAWFSPRMQYAKKGAKLSVYEKLFLSQNKATQRAVENLNKDIIKIFLQMMK